MGYEHFQFREGCGCEPGKIHFRPHHIERTYLILSIGSSDLDTIYEAMRKRWGNLEEEEDGWYSPGFLRENMKFLFRLPKFSPNTIIQIVQSLDEVCYYPGCRGTNTEECQEPEELDDFCLELGLDFGKDKYTLADLLNRFKFQYAKEEYRKAQRKELEKKMHERSLVRCFPDGI